MRRHLLDMRILGFLILILFSSLTALTDLQEHRVEISAEQDRYLFDIENPPVFSISAEPNCVVCVEVANDNKLFFKSNLRNNENFFSSFFGSETVEGIEIKTDEEGNAEYTLAMDPWNILTARPIKLYYRAFIIDFENSKPEQRQLAILASSLEDEAWQDAPYLEVFSSAEEEEEYDIREEAMVPFKKGLDLMEQEDFEAAIEEFLRANEMLSSPSSKIYLNISTCHLNLAIEYSKRILEDPKASDWNKRVSKIVIGAIYNLFNSIPENKEK